MMSCKTAIEALFMSTGGKTSSLIRDIKSPLGAKKVECVTYCYQRQQQGMIDINNNK